MTNYIVQQGQGRSVFSDFLRLPNRVYRNDPLWVPPITSEVRRTLTGKKNPYFAFATQERFVCYKDGVPVARMIVVLDPKQHEEPGQKTAIFGFFESINDNEAVRHLFSAAEGFARSLGATRLDGPFNPNYYSELGIKLDRFDSAPRFFETYNPEYYVSLRGAAGFHISRRLKTFRLRRLPEGILKRYAEATTLAPESSFNVRPLRLDDLEHDLDEIREVYNDAFATNPYFHDVSQAEYMFSAKYLRYVTEPGLTTLVEENGHAVAVVQIMQEVNPLLRRVNGRTGPFRFLKYQRDRKKIKSAVVYAIGIKKAHQGSYVTGLLLKRNVEILREFDEVSTTWISEDNKLMLDYCTRLGFEPDRSFAIFRKELRDHE